MSIRNRRRILAFSLSMASLFLSSANVQADSRSLDGLLTHVDLFGTEKPSEISLGQINSQSLVGSKIKLLGEFISIAGSYTFSLEHEPNTPIDDLRIIVVAMGHLTGSKTPPPPPGKLRTEPVANLVEKSGTLHLVWNMQNKTVHGRQLANSQLRFELDGNTHTIFFRNPKNVDAIPLDLKKPVQRISFKVNNPPRRGKLRVQLNTVSTLDGQSVFSFEGNILELGDKLILVKEGKIKSEIDIMLTKSSSGPQLTVKTFYLNKKNRRKPLVGSKVNAKYLGLQRSHNRKTQTLKAAKEALPKIEKELEKLSRRKARNLNELRAIAESKRRLIKQRRKAISAIKSYSRSLPIIENTMSELKEVIALGQELHENILFHFSLVVYSLNQHMLLTTVGRHTIKIDPDREPEPTRGNTELHPRFQQMVNEASIPLTKKDSNAIILEVSLMFNDIKNGVLSKNSPKVVAWENGVVLIGRGEIPSRKIAQAMVELLLSGNRPFALKFRDEIQILAMMQELRPGNVMKEILFTLNRTAGTSPQ